MKKDTKKSVLVMLAMMLFLAATYSNVLAIGEQFTGQSIEVAAETIGQKILLAVIICFFVGGAVLAGMGIFAAVNKDSNPQGSHGAWKKIAGGGALMAFSVVIGVLKATITG